MGKSRQWEWYWVGQEVRPSLRAKPEEKRTLIRQDCKSDYSELSVRSTILP